MSDALTIATNALSATSFQVAKDASSIVNASSTGSNGDLTTPITDLVQQKAVYGAEAKVIRVVAENNKALLDILA
jgi:flagellar basal body rod protein FlgG